MAWSVTADPQRFEEAVAWFRARVPITPGAWRALGEAARRRAFTVAGVAQLDLVQTVFAALDTAIADGLALEDWQQLVADRLQAAWGDAVANPAARLETIYRTNVQTAYAAGRHQHQLDPDVITARPYWMYDAVIDLRTSTICRGLNGTIRRADDPWWNERYPPNHFGCRSGVRSLTRSGAERRGGVTEDPNISEPDEGFRSRPDLDWTPDLSKYPQSLRDAYERKQRRTT